MVDQSDSVSIAAMVVALAALVIASGQLMQQLLGTADGYRRCQSSVMGQWALKTRRRWIWGEFRFETKYEVPEFELMRKYAIDKVKVVSNTNEKGHIIDNSTHSRGLTSIPKGFQYVRSPGMVSWLSFLDRLHEMQGRQMTTRPVIDGEQVDPQVIRAEEDAARVEAQRRLRCVVVVRRESSWDLLPPEIQRPPALCSLSTIITLAHRLGMSWKALRPSEGVMRAEGNGQSLSGTVVRSLGPVMQYSINHGAFDEDPRGVLAMARVPTVVADKMGFGIIPGDRRLFSPMWDLSLVSDKSEGSLDVKLLSSALEHLDVSPDAVEYICSQASKRPVSRLAGFSDLLGIWIEFLPLRGSHISSVIDPVGYQLRSPCESPEARLVWRSKLKQQIKMPQNHGGSKVSGHRRRVWEFFQLLSDEYPLAFQFQRGLPRGNNASDGKLLHKLRELFDFTTHWFQKGINEGTQGPENHFRFYVNLVASHVSVAAFSLQQAEKQLQSGSMAPTSGTLLTSQAIIYTENIEKVIDQMRNRDPNAKYGHKDPAYSDRELVADAWWMLMLRAVVWFMGNHRIEADEAAPVPSYYFNSSSMVYMM